VGENNVRKGLGERRKEGGGETERGKMDLAHLLIQRGLA
jgi:hypothetical protein